MDNNEKIEKDGQNDEENQMQKLPYPKSVFFIVSNEFCERFSYYGMRTILSLYLTDKLLYSESDATIIYHTFTMFVYFFPVFGAMLADSLLGKFKTIFYVSMIYAIGNIVLALAATPPLHMPGREFSILGLLLIATGTGGIKPCVSAFGGDQFVIPQQELQLAKFFSMFYFAINAGSLISTALTPILRQDVHCFDEQNCFSLAFAVPGVLMIVSIVVFALGKPLYKIRQPAGNMVLKVSKCIGNAISTRRKLKKTIKKDHWLDYAEEKYGKKLVEDIKATLKVLVLYIPLPVFWALFDQQATGWTFQARRMDGNLGFYTILPDQMQVINPLLILIFIPLFQYGIYPMLNKCNILKKPLQRLVAGGVLAAVAFIITACISLAIEAENPILPTATNGQLRIYNTLNCKMELKLSTPNVLGVDNIKINNLDYYQQIDISLTNGNALIELNEISNCLTAANKKFNFELKPETSTGYYVSNDKFVNIKDDIDKSDNGYPKFRVLMDKPLNFDIIDEEGIKQKTMAKGNDTIVSDLVPGKYRIQNDDTLLGKIDVKLGAVYAILINTDNKKMKEITLTEPNSINMLLLLPQYVIMTMGEIMFSITGLEFSYSQAPVTMKSVMQACWLLTTAFGNLIVVIIESARFFEDRSSDFFLYAGIMILDMLIFAWMATKYKYIEQSDSSTSDDGYEITDNKLKAIDGIDNNGFSKTVDDF